MLRRQGTITPSNQPSLAALSSSPGPSAGVAFAWVTRSTISALLLMRSWIRGRRPLFRYMTVLGATSPSVEAPARRRSCVVDILNQDGDPPADLTRTTPALSEELLSGEAVRKKTRRDRFHEPQTSEGGALKGP